MLPGEENMNIREKTVPARENKTILIFSFLSFKFVLDRTNTKNKENNRYETAKLSEKPDATNINKNETA